VSSALADTPASKAQARPAANAMDLLLERVMFVYLDP
jgi:hypothetical protein